MISRWVEHLFSLPTWLAVGIVFLFPAAEASIFLGFVIPGEIAVVLGGVMAYRGDVALWIILVAAISGAIIGDSIGYAVGRRWGRQVLESALGRFIKAQHFDRSADFIARRGALAVFLGRWTAALRALIPGLAGMSHVPYPTFLFWNVVGGGLWATTFVMLGYIAGNSYHHLEQQASFVSYGLLGLVAVGGFVMWLRVRRRHSSLDIIEDVADRLD